MPETKQVDHNTFHAVAQQVLDAFGIDASKCCGFRTEAKVGAPAFIEFEVVKPGIYYEPDVIRFEAGPSPYIEDQA